MYRNVKRSTLVVPYLKPYTGTERRGTLNVRVILPMNSISTIIARVTFRSAFSLSMRNLNGTNALASIFLVAKKIESEALKDCTKMCCFIMKTCSVSILPGIEKDMADFWVAKSVWYCSTKKFEQRQIYVTLCNQN